MVILVYQRVMIVMNDILLKTSLKPPIRYTYAYVCKCIYIYIHTNDKSVQYRPHMYGNICILTRMICNVRHFLYIMILYRACCNWWIYNTWFDHQTSPYPSCSGSPSCMPPSLKNIENPPVSDLRVTCYVYPHRNWHLIWHGIQDNHPIFLFCFQLIHRFSNSCMNRPMICIWQTVQWYL